MAINSPLLDNIDISGAMGILINITGGSKLTLHEVNSASMTVADAAHEDANIIFGSVIDESFSDEVKITVIATGFEQARPAARRAPVVQRREPSEPPFAMNVSSRPPVRRENLDTPTHIRQRWEAEGSQGPRQYSSYSAASLPAVTDYDGNTLDIPTYLRQQAD